MRYPHNPGYVPGTNVPIPYALEQGRLAMDAAHRAGLAAAEQAAVKRRESMAGRWFTPQHEWVAISGQTATVGISDYLTRVLGDRILFVSLPALGTTVIAGEPCGELESTRTIYCLHAPASGRVTAINGVLDEAPGTVHSAPYGDGWLFQSDIGPDGEAGLPAGLLSPADYLELVNGLG